MSKYQRKTYIVTDQQRRVTILILIYNVVAVVVTGLLIFLPSFIALSSGDSMDQAIAAREILVLHKRFWPAILIVIVLVGIHSIYFFHRLFGPLYRFKAVLREVAQGDLSFNFDIRKNDFFSEEKDVINNMITSLRKFVIESQKNNQVLLKSITQLDLLTKEPETTIDTVHEKLSDILKQADKVEKGLGNFKVS